MKRCRVAIIGAGFGGISAAKVLAESNQLEVHIFDRRNHHLFQPLLYQVAMAGLNPSEIAIPIRKLFSKNKNVNVTLAEVEKIDVTEKKIYFDHRWESFDYIVISSGAKHSYFGNNEWEPIAPGLKNIEQATEIRRRILTAFELAEKQTDPEKQRADLSFAVVGGGPTGVELAGAISEMARNTLKQDYKRADLNQTKVYLIEAGPRVLAAFPESLSKRAEKDLRKLSVDVIKNKRASRLSSEGLYVGDSWIPCHTIIWAAGVTPSSLASHVSSKKDEQGRIAVTKELSLDECKNIFAIGDVAKVIDKNGKPLPGIAPVAIQQGIHVGHQILAVLKGKDRKEFIYWDKGIMATIGRSKAVVSSGKLKLTGFIAWIAWVLIHILYLMKFKNRVFVFLQWAWSYFKFGHGARLIVHKTWRFYGGKKISYENHSDS